MLTEKLNDTEVEQLHKNYENHDNHVKAFNQFNSALSEHLSNKNKVDEYIKAATETSLFLSEVASLTQSRTLSQFAKGLGAATQIFSGLKDVGNVLNTMAQATSLADGLSLATFSSFVGGAGLALGGLSILSSLLNSGHDDRANEALEEMYATLLGMWSEMRESFQYTWEN
jgi:hypothetical protein